MLTANTYMYISSAEMQFGPFLIKSLLMELQGQNCMTTHFDFSSVTYLKLYSRIPGLIKAALTDLHLTDADGLFDR